MIRASVLAVFVIAITSAICSADVTLFSWENTLQGWDAVSNFETYAFTSFDGVTAGTYAVELDLKPGWSHGLRSTGYPGYYADDPEKFYPAGGTTIGNAGELRLDVTTSNSLLNVPMSSGLQLNLFFQGGTNRTDSSTWFGYNFGYQLVGASYAADVTTETVVWDLTHDIDGLPVNLPDMITNAAGWADMRIQTNVIGGATNPGIIIVDNLRVAGAIPPQIWGDFSGDGKVDQADYTTFADYFGWLIADVRAIHPNFFPPTSYMPGTTTVNQAMYTTWADHFGTMYPASVPEPATMALLGLGALALIRRKR